MKQVITNLKAGTPGMYIATHEEGRIEAELHADAMSLGYATHVWSITEGIRTISNTMSVTNVPDTQDPMAMLELFMKPKHDSGAVIKDESILICRDLHMFLGSDAGPMIIRKLRDALNFGKQCGRAIIAIGCKINLPAEVEKDFVIIEFALPDRSRLCEILNGIADSAGIKLKAEDREPLLDAAAGLTTGEAESAFAISVAECKAITAEVIHREKASTVKKNGTLEIVTRKVGLNDIGGLELLKSDLHSKRNLFTKSARDYGLPSPRGCLLVGNAGAGKSLAASATAAVFGLPLIKLEAGKLFGSLVGQSEAEWRKAFSTVQAVRPCILWVDEVDGLFAGSTGDSRDGGTTQRVIKAILQDMQFNSEGIYFVFTANDIDRLPDPLIDRLDVWFVDLPTLKEREQIWKIHIAKIRTEGAPARKPAKFNLQTLAELSEGYSGRQIEQVWITAMTAAFNDDGREPEMKDVEKVISQTVPTSKTMASEIEARRKRLQGRARPTSASETPVAVKPAPGSRKLS